MEKPTLGFDIGSGELKIVQWNGQCVQRAVRVSLPDNLVRDGRIVSYEALAQLIRETVRSQHLTTRHAAVILPAGQCYLRRLTMPAMTVDQLAVNLPYEFRDILSAGKNRYFYDYAVNRIDRGEDSTPVQMDLTAAAVPKALIDDYRAMFRRAGLELRTAVPVECAYANLLRSREEREFCVLDLGCAMTWVHIFTGSCFEATRQLDCGLSTVDAAIAEDQGVDEHVARRTYKETDYRGVQSSESARNVYHAIATDIRKAINFYGFNNRQSDLTDAWCAGGGIRIPALPQDIAQSIDLKLHTIDELLPPADEGGEDLPFFAAAVGAAMQ